MRIAKTWLTTKECKERYDKLGHCSHWKICKYDRITEIWTNNRSAKMYYFLEFCYLNWQKNVKETMVKG